MKKAIIALLVLLFPFLVQAQKINIMLVNGGHAYDTVQLFQFFESYEKISYQHYVQPEANKIISKERANEFDVLVFFDMRNEISNSWLSNLCNISLNLNHITILIST